MEVTQAQVNALEKWVEYKKDVYLKKGFLLAAEAGIGGLEAFKSGEGIPAEEKEKSLSDLKAELDLAEEFHRDAKQLLFAGRQGG